MLEMFSQPKPNSFQGSSTFFEASFCTLRTLKQLDLMPSDFAGYRPQPRFWRRLGTALSSEACEKWHLWTWYHGVARAKIACLEIKVLFLQAFGDCLVIRRIRKMTLNLVSWGNANKNCAIWKIKCGQYVKFARNTPSTPYTLDKCPKYELYLPIRVFRGTLQIHISIRICTLHFLAFVCYKTCALQTLRHLWVAQKYACTVDCGFFVGQ